MKKISLFLILFTTTNLFAQETTGRVRTQDKYFSENGNYNVNGKRFKKNEVREGFSSDHIFFKNIKMPQSFVETTFYDENNNNQVWSHHWGIVESTSKRTNKNEAVPVNVSFKWVDGKIVNASWIFDPSIKIQEIMASQK